MDNSTNSLAAEREQVAEIVEPHTWSADVKLDLSGYADGSPPRIEVSGTLRPARRVNVTPEQARDALYASAQTIIALVESEGWRHVQHPTITITGKITEGRGKYYEPLMVAEGEITLLLTRPPQSPA